MHPRGVFTFLRLSQKCRSRFERVLIEEKLPAEQDRALTLSRLEIAIQNSREAHKLGAMTACVEYSLECYKLILEKVSSRSLTCIKCACAGQFEQSPLPMIGRGQLAIGGQQRQCRKAYQKHAKVASLDAGIQRADVRR